MLTRWQMLVGAVTLAASLVGIGIRATYDAQVSADEPQYLLTAISLGEDLDLDISDELREQRFIDFHEVPLDQQTAEQSVDGQRLSPHDPLLPLILVGPMLIGGWVAAKALLSIIAALTAVATLTLAVRRFGVAPGTAAIVTLSFFVAAPFTAYGTQVYPAMPAALFVVLGVAGVTGRQCWRSAALTVLSVVALPWLSVKYVPIAAVIAGAALLRFPLVGSQRRRGSFAVVAGVLVAAGGVYLLVHQRIWGGWTVYSTGDHFVGGEFEVVGTNPNYVARSNRLLGLLIDRFYGVAAWAPLYLLTPPALMAMFQHGRHRRWMPTGDSAAVLAVIAVGWAMATWVALTMHGWWWAGRQIVPVLPLVVVGAAILVERMPRLRTPTVLAGLWGAFNWFWMVFETSTGRLALIVDHEDTTNPLFSLWSRLLPDHRVDSIGDQLLTIGWGIVLAVGTYLARRALNEQSSTNNTVDRTTAVSIG